MRQQFGKFVIDLLDQGKRILNVDETWIAYTNYSRSTWQPSWNYASQPEYAVLPRVTLIAALDNWGDLYISVL